MSNATFSWSDSWTATSIFEASIGNGSDATSAAISNDGKIATEISVEVAYGTTATEGVKVYVLRDGVAYETENDKPFGMSLQYSTSTSYRKTFTVRGDEVSRFKILITNDSGDTVDASAYYKQLDSVNIA
ncbi:MAG: hypothetical protein CL946_06315 [Ectothiorhodospiraceae bacterium]|nr:hypothetical protein [Ectothiorhodospiraceae bacterium]